MLALKETQNWILWLIIIGVVIGMLVLLVSTFLTEGVGGLWKLNF